MRLSYRDAIDKLTVDDETKGVRDMGDTYESLNKMLGEEKQLLDKNEYGKDVNISRHDGYVLTTTFQFDGWTRKNRYYDDGVVEESFKC